MAQAVNNVRKAVLAGFLLLCLTTSVLIAAQPAVEGFGSGANGWEGTSSSFSGSWSFSGGIARVNFQADFPFGDIGTLKSSLGATSGSFTGNYDIAGIDAIGFSFLAPYFPPSGEVVILQWGGSTSVYRRSFPITQTGIWYNCVASMLEEDKSEWFVQKGSLNDFATARQSVTNVAVLVGRSLAVEHEFLIDDIFVAAMPGGASMTSSTNGLIVWDGLLAGIGYQVQSTTNLLAAPWVPVESLTATGTLHTTQFTNTTRDIESFRIRFQ